jgi:ABC-type multidrug transport system ATPase subunit
MVAVRLEAVSTRRPGTRGAVLQDVDLELATGDRVTIVGANGSGKSTLLRTTAGLSRPVAGRVVDRPATVAYLPDRVEPPPRLTGRGWLHLVLATRGVSHADQTLDVLATELGVSPGLDDPVGTLSRGNLVKVGLVQLLLSGADLLVLDEPYAALDAAGAEALDRLLADCATAGAIVVEAAPHPTAAPGHTTYRIESGTLVRPAPVDADLPRVRVVLVRADGQPRAHEVTAHEVDDLLRDALADGWSVREVRTLPDVAP